MKLKVINECPPIPLRGFDWQAYDEDTMDVCMDHDCSCRRSVVQAFAATEEEAVYDFVFALLDKLDVSVSEMMSHG